MTATEDLRVIQFKDAVKDYSWTEYTCKKLFGNSAASCLDKNLELAIQYTESQCTSKFGYLTDVSRDPELRNSVVCIPNIFDTALIIDLLHTSGITISRTVISTVLTLLLRNKSKLGLFNFFHVDKIIPDDIDTSSNSSMALLACGLKEQEVAQVANNIYKQLVVHDDGLVDIYFPKATRNVEPLTNPDRFEAAKYLDKWREYRRIDLITIANLLYLLNRVEVNHMPKLSECYKVLERSLSAIVDNRYPGNDKEIDLYAKSYTQVDILCFFISRLIPVSTHAKSLFKEKVTRIVEKQGLTESGNPVLLACRIMAGINAGMFEKEEDRVLILEEAQKLLKLQNKNDFSFPKTGLYNAHGLVHFGSKAISTAFGVAAIASLKREILKIEIGDRSKDIFTQLETVKINTSG